MTTLKLSREILFSPEKIFAAITDPSRLARWWGPDGFTNSFDICDVKPGGQWIFTMHAPNGVSYNNESRFLSIENPNKIVIQHVCEPKFILTLNLITINNNTLLEWISEFENDTFVKNNKKNLLIANEQNIDRLIKEVKQYENQNSDETNEE